MFKKALRRMILEGNRVLFTGKNNSQTHSSFSNLVNPKVNFQFSESNTFQGSFIPNYNYSLQSRRLSMMMTCAGGGREYMYCILLRSPTHLLPLLHIDLSRVIKFHYILIYTKWLNSITYCFIQGGWTLIVVKQEKNKEWVTLCDDAFREVLVSEEHR